MPYLLLFWNFPGGASGCRIAECYNNENKKSARPVFFTFETEKFQSHKIRPRPRLKSFGLKRQDQYQDLWYTVLIFETKTALGLKRHSRPLYVKTNDESLADLWWKPTCLFGLGLKIKSIVFGIRFKICLGSIYIAEQLLFSSNPLVLTKFWGLFGAYNFCFLNITLFLIYHAVLSPCG